MDAQTIKSLVAIFLAAILTENYILNKFLGICPFLGVSKKLDTAVGMSCAVTVVMVISTAVTWPLYTYLLVPNGLGYLQTIVFILVIAALVQLLETALRKYMPPLYNALGIYLPLITTNCAVLGVTMLVLEKGAEDPTFGYLQSLVNAFGSGVGFLVAMVLFAFTTLIGNLYYVDNCLSYIVKKVPAKEFMILFRIDAMILIFIGAGMRISTVWNLADVLMGIMAILNLPVIVILARPALAALKDYTTQKKQGKNPVFKAASIGLKEKTDYWN